jgi:histone deacetylase 1/2
MLWCPRKTTTVSEPQSFNQANKSVEWRAAIQDEFDALISNRTLSLVPKPPEANAVGNNWSYRIKRSADGRVKRFKGSIGCKGFHTTILYIFHWKF